MDFCVFVVVVFSKEMETKEKENKNRFPLRSELTTTGIRVQNANNRPQTYLKEMAAVKFTSDQIQRPTCLLRKTYFALLHLIRRGGFIHTIVT